MKIYKSILASIACSLMLSGCNFEETWHSEVTPDTFFKSPQDVAAAVYRPFTHARWYATNDRWHLQEQPTDQFAITTKGPHWENGGENYRFHYHTWTPDEGKIWDTWRGTLMGVALALDTKTDLEKLNYTSVALTEADKQKDLNQLNTLIGYFYLRGLDFFGGLPIFSDLSQSNLARSTDVEVFNHVEKTLKDALPNLNKKTEGQAEEGEIRQAAAAMLLAQLYFNAQAYINKPMFTECATICQDILDGKYGAYSLDPTWYGVNGFYNDKSPEMIWSMPSQFNKLENNWFNSLFYHYNTRVYFDKDGGADNGMHLQPSRKPDSTFYTSEFKLGSPYAKFHDKDLRKQPYAYKGSGKYTGMFLVGKQISPITGKECLGGEEYKDQLIVFDDRVGKFDKGPVTAAESVMKNGEENTGIRLVKVPIPSDADKNLRWGADQVMIRLAETYYMLAECKLRAGDKQGAADLINTVRKRNFEGNIDPAPVKAAELDGYKMLDEWGVEFLGEGRRRTDLIRWNMFLTESWWDHKPTTSKHLNRYPVPTRAISASNVLTQNPGY